MKGIIMAEAARKATTKPPTAPAAPTKARAPKTVAPALDFASLAVTEAPAPRRNNAVAAENNPAIGWLKESWAKKTVLANTAGQTTYRGAGKQVVVPTANSVQVQSLIRSAAIEVSKELGERIGSAVQVEDLGGGKVSIRFCAKTAKTARKPKVVTPPPTTPAQ